MANVSKLLHASQSDDLLSKLNPTDAETGRLNEAKLVVRNHLRDTFSSLGRAFSGTAITPRFFTQGSAAYKTLNRPALLPPQQMDLDDGAYLPMSTLRNAPKPSLAATAFFEIVDRALTDLASRHKGWKFAEKPTCSRLIIGSDAHIDVPLYAIPDEQFEALAKAARADGQLTEDMAFDFMEGTRDRDDWRLLPSEKILLAHREQDWIASDPRKIHRWFIDAVALYGEQLRRVCRYLKAWRDYHAGLEPVASILLMVCVWRVYENVGRRAMPIRDDLALDQITDRLPDLLRGPVSNPTDPSERLDARLTPTARQAAIDAARQLRDLVNSTVNHCYHQDVAVENMRKAFGPRIPLRPDLVTIEKAAAAVLGKAPAIVAAPDVRRSISG